MNHHEDETLDIAGRLEYLRGELRAERISYGELAWLQAHAEHIAPGDVELLEAAGVPETVTLEPNWDAMRRYVRNVYRTDRPAARRIAATMGREAPTFDECETCGRATNVACHLCGTCAEDWNDRDVAAGTRRINRRRRANGLEELTRDA